MIYKRFEIDKEERSATFTPPANADFASIETTIPNVQSGPEKEQYREGLQRCVRDACGSAACQAEASIIYIKDEVVTRVMSEFSPEVLWLEDATFKCSAGDCPLNGPGGAGDREPRNPSPNPPTLYAELSV